MNLVLVGSRRDDRAARPHIYLPRMYAEALAFSLKKRRPRAVGSLLDPSEDLEAATRRARPHLIVANRVPRVETGVLGNSWPKKGVDPTYGAHVRTRIGGLEPPYPAKQTLVLGP